MSGCVRSRADAVSRFFAPCVKPDSAFGRSRGRLHLLHLNLQPVNIFRQNFDYGNRAVLAALQLFDSAREVFVSGDDLPDPHEGARDEDIHLNGPPALQDEDNIRTPCSVKA